MKLESKVVGLLLMAALLMGTPAKGVLAPSAHVSGASAALAERPAGCHGHGRAPDSPPQHLPPVPVSYRCCVTGHDAVVVRASDAPPPAPLRTTEVLHFYAAVAAGSVDCLNISFVLFTGPPGTTPLRI